MAGQDPNYPAANRPSTGPAEDLLDQQLTEARQWAESQTSDPKQQALLTMQYQHDHFGTPFPSGMNVQNGQLVDWSPQQSWLGQNWPWLVLAGAGGVDALAVSGALGAGAGGASALSTTGAGAGGTGAAGGGGAILGDVGPGIAGIGGGDVGPGIGAGAFGGGGAATGSGGGLLNSLARGARGGQGLYNLGQQLSGASAGLANNRGLQAGIAGQMANAGQTQYQDALNQALMKGMQAPIQGAQMATRGDLLSNMQDVTPHFTPGQGYSFTGGIRPSALGPNARAAGQNLSNAGLAWQNNQNLPQVPNLTANFPSAGASGLENVLSGAGAATGVLGSLMGGSQPSMTSTLLSWLRQQGGQQNPNPTGP